MATALQKFGSWTQAGFEIVTSGKFKPKSDGTNAFAQAFVLIDPANPTVPITLGLPTTAQAGELITLATNSSTAGTSSAFLAYGGDYIFSILVRSGGSFTGGPTAQLQTRDPVDNTTWTNLGAARTTADSAASPAGGTGVTIGGQTTVRLVLTGTFSGVDVVLSRIPN